MYRMLSVCMIVPFLCLFGLQSIALATDGKTKANASPHDEYLYTQPHNHDVMYPMPDGSHLMPDGTHRMLSNIQKEAKAGKVEFQIFLATRFELGDGVPQSYKNAAHWFEAAAKQGNVDAQRTLAAFYAQGLGVEQDDKKTAYWAELAAKQGDTQSQFNMASMSVHGKGVKQDFKKARYWYRLLAEEGHVRAQYLLACLHDEEGDATSEDYHEAKRWYEEAARQGHEEAKEKAKAMKAKTRELGFSMDTSEWKTYPIGRYLIDLPKDAIFYWWPFKLATEELVWKKDMTIEEAKKLLTEEAEKAKKAPHESGENQFVALHTDYTPNGESILLVQRDGQYGSKYLFKAYFVNTDAPNVKDAKEKRVYYYEEDKWDKEGDTKSTENYIMQIVTPHVAAREHAKPSERIANTYFNGGIFFSRGEKHFRMHEEIALDIHFPKYPGIELYLNLEHSNSPGTHYRQDHSNGKAFTIAGNPVREFSSKTTKKMPDSSVVWPPRDPHAKYEDDGITRYSFFLGSETHNADGSDFIMRLSNPSGRTVRDGAPPFPPKLKRSSFRSDEEARAFWETVRDSIRYRPYGWTEETDKKQDVEKKKNTVK